MTVDGPRELETNKIAITTQSAGVRTHYKIANHTKLHSDWPKNWGVTNPFVICDLGKLCKTYQSYLLEAFVVLQRGYFSASHEHVTDEHSYSIQFKDSQRSFSIGLLAQTALAMRTFFSSKGAFKKSRPGFSCLCSSEKRNPVQSFSGHESCGKNSLMISRSVHLVRTHAVLTTFEI